MYGAEGGQVHTILVISREGNRMYPPSGLIVSCYLESMRGCEKQFIASVVNHPKVIGLRIEGIDNIKWARMLTDKFIVGLIKKLEAGKIDITPEYKNCHDILFAGANMVATGCFLRWGDIMYREPLMLDCDKERYLELKSRHVLIDIINQNEIILATTYENKGYDLLNQMKDDYPDIKVNFEGGIMDHEDISKAFMLGADWVTVGKAINDPPTIVNNLMDGVL